MHSGIELVQIHPDCDVVNLPVTGPAPDAGFSAELTGLTLAVDNTSAGGNRYYWTFGDGGVSNDEEPVYVYGQGGMHEVSLRVSNEDAMMDLHTVQVGPQESAPAVAEWGLVATMLLVVAVGALVLQRRGSGLAITRW